MLLLRQTANLLILGVVVIMFNPSFVAAQTFYSANAEALGDAGRAAVDPLGSHFLNPATLVFTTGDNFGFAFQEARPNSYNPTNTYAFVLTDNNPESFAAAGAAYVYKRSSYDDHVVVDQDFSLSVGTRVLPKLFLGVQAHRWVRQNTGGPSWGKHNLSTGILLTPTEFFALALVAYDMLNDDDLDMVPVVALGANVNVINIFHLRVDATRQEKKNPNHQGALLAGIEFDVGSGFLLRTGGIWDGLNNQTFWTGGVGWLGPRLNVAYAYKSNVNVAGDATHTFQAWISF